RLAAVGDEDVASRADRDRVGVTQRRAELFFFGDFAVAAEPFDEGAGGGEFLDPAVGPVGGVDESARGDRDADDFVHLAGAFAGEARLAGGFADLGRGGAVFDAPAEGADEGALAVELVDPVVAGVGDVDVAGGRVDRDTTGVAQLAGGAAGRSEGT